MLRTGSMVDLHGFLPAEPSSAADPRAASDRGSDKGSEIGENPPLIVLGRRTTDGGVDLKLEPATSPAALEELLRTMVAEILKVDHDEIKSRTPLMDLGFDSRTALTLRQRLGSALQREFSPTLLFNYPSIEALVGHILGVEAPKEGLAFRGDTVNESIAVIGMACRYP